MAAALIDIKKRSVFTYHRVLLFNYDVQCRRPFSSYNRSMFSDEDIPKTWFTGPLSPTHRRKVLSLPPLGGGRFSVFGKIEIGTCTKRRDAIEKDLNDTFQELLDQEFPLDEAYSTMILARPSKVLSGWTYQSKPKPLRSSRTAGEVCDTAPETEDEAVRSDYHEFCSLLLNGQRIADTTKKTFVFNWRGYRACISSELPKLSSHEMERRFNLAVESIKEMEKDKNQQSQIPTQLPSSQDKSNEGFKKPSIPISSSESAQSSSLSSHASSQSILSDEETTQIPETQFFDMDVPNTHFLSSQVGTTQPVSQASTESQTTEAQATEAQATEAQATEAQVTEAQATEVQVTEAPPTTDAPTSKQTPSEAQSITVQSSENKSYEVPSSEVASGNKPSAPPKKSMVFGVSDEDEGEVNQRTSSEMDQEIRGEKEKPPRAAPITQFQNQLKSKAVFSTSPVAPIGNDGGPLKTSVCDEISESVQRAANIEKQIQHSKDNDYESYEQQLEDEQDLLGLYESELNKQMHLRNRQKKEWDRMKKKMVQEEENSNKKKAQEKELLDQEQREENRKEMEETHASKAICTSMVKSAMEQKADTIDRIVEVLQNQNGQTITIKRSSKTLVQASKLQAERDKVFADNQEKIISILEDIQQTFHRLAGNLDMKRKVQIDHFFPVNSLLNIKRFLDKSDGQFDLRRDEFENYLYTTVTTTVKLKRPFESSLLASLFTREFMSSHKWPACPGGPSIDPDDSDIVVPEELATIIKITLSKMVAVKCLNPSFINLDFWRRIPGKFKGIRLYEDKKTKIKELAEIRLGRPQLQEEQEEEQQQEQQPQRDSNKSSTEAGTGRKRRTKYKKKTETSNAVVPIKKKRKEKSVEKEKDVGETVQEEQMSDADEPGCNSTLGESIYEDFDDANAFKY